MVEGKFGIVAATPAAAKLVSSDGRASSVVTSYGDSARARAAARQLAARGAQAIISFGPAVGLAPLLRPGDLLVATSVVLPSGAAIATDSVWRAGLVQRLAGMQPSLKVARLAGRDRLAASAGEKHSLFQATFAAALDTESHAIAEEAEAAGLPFLAVRAIADPAERSRPWAACRMGQAWTASLPACLGRPWELPAVWGFLRNSRAALTTLRLVAALGPAPFAFGG